MNSGGGAVCLNRRNIAAGPPSEVLTEQVLTETFQRHLFSLAPGGQLEAAAPEGGDEGA